MAALRMHSGLAPRLAGPGTRAPATMTQRPAARSVPGQWTSAAPCAAGLPCGWSAARRRPARPASCWMRLLPPRPPLAYSPWLWKGALPAGVASPAIFPQMAFLTHPCPVWHASTEHTLLGSCASVVVKHSSAYWKTRTVSTLTLYTRALGLRMSKALTLALDASSAWQMQGPLIERLATNDRP